MIKAIWLDQKDKVTSASLRDISDDALTAGGTTVRGRVVVRAMP